MTTWECSVCWQVIEEHRKADIRKHRISHIRENDWAKLEKSVSRSKTRHWLNEQTEQPTLTSSAQNSVGDSPCTSFESPGSNFSKENLSVDESSPDATQRKTGSKVESPVPTPESSKPRRSLYKCDFCDFKGKRDGIVRHVKFDHKEKLDKWRTKQSDVLYLPCDQCDQFFASMDDRDAHFKTKHLKPESLIRGNPGGSKRQASEMKDTRNMSPADSVRLFVRKKLEKRDSRSKSKTRESLLNLCKEYTSGAPTLGKETEDQKVDVILTCPSSKAEAFFSGRLSFCPYHPCEATFKGW